MSGLLFQLTTQGIIINDILTQLPLQANSTRLFDLQKDVILNVVDDLGVRYCTKDSKLIQTQIVLEKQPADIDDPKMPANTFSGTIEMLNKTLSHPVILTDFTERDDIRILKDTDSIQYGLNIYYVYLGDKKYTLWVDKDDMLVTSIYF